MPKVSDAHMAAQRERVLNAARVCFSVAGIHPTTIEDIRREAGMSTGGLYRHFASKSAIVHALFEQGGRDASERAGQLDGLSHVEALVVFLTGAIAQITRPDARTQLRMSAVFHAEAARDPQIAAPMRHQLQSLTDLLEGRIRGAQATGSLPDSMAPRAAAAALIASVEGLKTQLLLDPTLDADAYLHALVTAWFRG